MYSSSSSSSDSGMICIIVCIVADLDVEKPPRIAKPDLNQPPSAISNKSLALFLTSVHRTVETNEV